MPTPATCREALNISSPQLYTLVKFAGETKVNALLANMISRLVMFFNVGKTMNNAQVSETVRLIIRKYDILRPEELEYCFNKIKTGDYGKLYDRIDGAVIFECLDAYMIEREATIFAVNEELKTKTDNVYDSALQALADKGLKIEPKKLFKVEDKPTPPRERTPAERLVQDFIREFDALYDANEPVKPKGIKFVPYKGEQMDLKRYLTVRMSGETKGAFGNECNRTDCNNQGAKWYNYSTRKYYCQPCATTINNYNRADAYKMFGHELCMHKNEPVTEI